MAKKHVKRLRRKRERAETALTELARTLDKCDFASIKLVHGIVVSKYGYVIPMKKGWQVRMLAQPTSDDSDYSDD